MFMLYIGTFNLVYFQIRNSLGVKFIFCLKFADTMAGSEIDGWEAEEVASTGWAKLSDTTLHFCL